jgi:hypothetical protein
MNLWGPRTQVSKQAIATNQTTIIHTVTAGKILHLLNALLHLTAAAVGNASILVRDGSDVTVRHLAGVRVGATTQNDGVPQFNPAMPMEIPAGYDVCVVSSIAGLTAEGDIFGYEIDV